MGYAARLGLSRQQQARERHLAELDDQQRVRELTTRIPDEDTLIRILDDCRPAYRELVKAQLWPYLSFVPVREPAPPVPVQEPLDVPTAQEAEGDTNGDIGVMGDL